MKHYSNSITCIIFICQKRHFLEQISIVEDNRNVHFMYSG